LPYLTGRIRFGRIAVKIKLHKKLDTTQFEMFNPSIGEEV